MEAPKEELRFLPCSAADGEGDVVGAAGGSVDGVERVLVGGVVLLDDILVDPIIIVIVYGMKEVLKSLLFFCNARPCNSFSTSIASWNNLLIVLYSL
jgi:hypothetical protein